MVCKRMSWMKTKKKKKKEELRKCRSDFRRWVYRILDRKKKEVSCYGRTDVWYVCVVGT